MSTEKTYSTEAELCNAFIEWIKEENKRARRSQALKIWTPYAETAGWDILLVADDGTQIGIEAKLKFNMKVLAQSLPDCWDYYAEGPGPDYRAVLVPKFDSEHERICAALGVVMISTKGHGAEFRPDIDPGNSERHAPMWHHWNPSERCKLPDYLPDVQAGSPAPLRLTEWKVKALRILATIEARGFVTKLDFRKHRIDPRAWTGAQGLLVPGNAPGQFVRGKATFDKQHPAVYAQVLAEVSAEVVNESPPAAIFAEEITAQTAPQGGFFIS